jgi:hypothetical protein
VRYRLPASTMLNDPPWNKGPKDPRYPAAARQAPFRQVSGCGAARTDDRFLLPLSDRLLLGSSPIKGLTRRNGSPARAPV